MWVGDLVVDEQDRVERIVAAHDRDHAVGVVQALDAGAGVGSGLVDDTPSPLDGEPSPGMGVDHIGQPGGVPVIAAALVWVRWRTCLSGQAISGPLILRRSWTSRC